MTEHIQAHIVKQSMGSYLNRIVTKTFQGYWRLSRGLTIGAQGLIFDNDQNVLLVKHGYRPGWHFPGGGVERTETINTALEREIFEEVGIILKGPPLLHGIFTNFKAFPGDHIALFIIRDWEQPTVPKANREIAEQRFFSYNDLPNDLVAGARNRLTEIFEHRDISETWT